MKTTDPNKRAKDVLGAKNFSEVEKFSFSKDEIR